MSTLKKYEYSGKSYFDELPKGTQDLVRDLLIEAANDRGGPEGWKSDDECIEDVECRSRDGFIAFSHNCGGLMYRNFTDLMGYWGGGYTPSHVGAATAIEKQIEYSFECLKESAFEHFKELLESKGLTKEDCTYHRMEELETSDEDLKDVRRYIEEGESETLGGSESSIMHELRFMYHGTEDGTHSASISAAVNTEGPYHRSSISWAPDVFCEGAKEVEITWKTQSELRKKLKAAFAKVSKEVF